MTLSLPTGRFMIALPSQSSARKGVHCALLDPTWPPKDPDETNDYGVDWYWVFDGQPPATVTATVQPVAAVVVGEDEIIGTAYVARISGGTDGVAATIRFLATCADGRVEVRSVALPIRAIDPVPASSATTSPQTTGQQGSASSESIVTLAAAGSSALDACPIDAAVSIFTSGPFGAGCSLQPGEKQHRVVLNRRGIALPVYPPPGGSIGTLGVDVPTSIDPGVTAVFDTVDGLTWFVT